MCLAIPVRVVELRDDATALVDLDGIRKEISLALVDGVQVGDYVILHVGYALSRLDPEEAERTLALFAELPREGAAQRCGGARWGICSRRSRRRARSSWSIAYGPGYLPYLADALRMDRSMIAEWRPRRDGHPCGIVAWMLSLLVVVYGAARCGVRNAPGLLLLVVTALLSLRHQRHVSIYAIV